MPFNAQVYHDAFTSHDESYASTTLCKDISWQHSANGLIIVDHKDQTPFTGFIVGRVSPWNLKCGTTSNYLKKGGLEKAKYHRQSEMLCVIANLFEQRPICIPYSPHGKRAPDAPKMDSTTENWVIPTDLEDQFKLVKYTHCAVPLPVFEDDQAISPLDANQPLDGALVKVHFLVFQWHVQGYDTFLVKARKHYDIKHPLSDVDNEEPAHRKQEVAVANGNRDKRLHKLGVALAVELSSIMGAMQAATLDSMMANSSAMACTFATAEGRAMLIQVVGHLSQEVFFTVYRE
ncbi:uncharacterized protein F5891DRAFT_979783 [Suillus fuscotomentosus]|uniref:Uncharacterized protein n=1 Tax=Suillus fuscotomentosus TaxID=1912939 RepID=A0AAD4E6Y4_9AGAM|nr:uncharacterized protein F5891DRAFT_979783 [Suillus fuscotomentosus]KAG1900880.1 hypothetical protein F5891DRAFT_979783 [Suillus fuscotomentosus]